MYSRFAVGLVLALVLTACGSPDGAVGATSAPSPLPVLEADPERWGQAVTGTLIQVADACWELEQTDRNRIVVFPPGWALAADASLIGPAGERLTTGDAVDGWGAVVVVEALTDAATGIVTECDEAAFEVVALDRLEPLFDPTLLTNDELASLLDGASFTDSWSCGLGFAMSTADQRVSIVIHAVDVDRAPEPTIVLPSDDWHANVLVGNRLMANWCNDAIEPWAADPVVAASWPIVEGILVHDPAPEVGCLPYPVSGTLTGAAVDTDAGSRDLVEITMTNRSYGCFAG